MTDQIVIRAERREQMGKSASRRLRRLADQVPGILYGGGVDPVALTIAHRDLAKAMQEEAFFSQILSVQVGELSQACVLRDLQRHPATDKVQHIDFFRIRDDLPVHVHVPLHYINEEQCVGVKLGGGRLAHNLIEVEVSCLPRDLPEFIEVDVGALEVGHSLHLSDLVLPAEVTIIALTLGDDRDIPVVGVTTRRGAAAAADDAADAAAAAAADAAGDAAGEDEGQD